MTFWLALVFGLLAHLTPLSAAEEGDGERSEREATALFRAVLWSDAAMTGPCALSDEWLHYAVPENVAKKYLELKIHADLIPSEHPIPRQILDPEGERKDVLCNDSEIKRRRIAQTETLRNDEQKGKIKTTSVQLSLPVLSDDLGRAIFVYVYETHKLCKIKNFDKIIDELYIYGVAIIYDKANNSWKPVGREELFFAE